MLHAAYIGLIDPVTNEPRCLTCSQDGGSTLKFYNPATSELLKVKRVVHTPSDVHLVWVEKREDDPALYDALKSTGQMCGLDRHTTTKTMGLFYGGEAQGEQR